VPNFVDHGAIPIEPNPSKHKWIVAARLTPEKGVLSLVESLPDGIALDIFGSGPEFEKIKKLDKPNVKLKGLASEADLALILPSYIGMVFPSRVLENSPIAVLMALEAGIPIVAKQGSAGADLVEEYAVGSTYSEIPRSLDKALESVEGISSLRARAKSVYEAHFNPRSWINGVEKVLAGVLAN
jgi:glycosyltransferase involved in cell wall biosynthesis